MNYITIKGEKFPVFNTPLTDTDILKIRENHERFIINEVGRSKMVLHRNPISYNKYRIDLGFRSMVNVLLLVVGTYYVYSFKKKVTKMNPFPTSKETKDFIDSLGKQAKNGKPDPISL